MCNRCSSSSIQHVIVTSSISHRDWQTVPAVHQQFMVSVYTEKFGCSDEIQDDRKHVGARPRGRYDMQPSWINYWLLIIRNTKHFHWWNALDDMCRMRRWSFRSYFDKIKMCAKNDFYFFVPSDLHLWPLDLWFSSLVTLVQGHVSTKLKFLVAFLFRENRKNGADRHTY